MLRCSIMVKLLVTIKSKIILMFFRCRNFNLLLNVTHQILSMCHHILLHHLGLLWVYKQSHHAKELRLIQASKHLPTYVRRLRLKRQLMILTIFSSNVRLTIRMQVEKQHQNKRKIKSFSVVIAT